MANAYPLTWDNVLSVVRASRTGMTNRQIAKRLNLPENNKRCPYLTLIMVEAGVLTRKKLAHEGEDSKVWIYFAAEEA